MAQEDQTPMGIYGTRRESTGAFCTEGLYDLLQIPQGERLGMHCRREELMALIQSRLTEPFGENIWILRQPGQVRYVLHRSEEREGTVIGTLLDVTREVELRLRAEHERDHDGMTGLMNRAGFFRGAQQLLGEGREAVLLMVDIDDLKEINDSFGHDAGDRAIRALVDTMKDHLPPDTLLCRYAGDEFVALIPMHTENEALEAQLHPVWRLIQHCETETPQGITFPVRCSAGLCRYPQDTADLRQLVTFADYALYRIKRGDKGHLAFFSRLEYDRGSYMLNGRGDLNQLIRRKAVSYAYQPILDAVTGNTVGWEMLMRPQLPRLRSPEMVMRLAEEYGLIHVVQYLTWECALAAVDEIIRSGSVPPDTCFFINSIGDQRLTNEETAELDRRFGHLFPRIVLQVTEQHIVNINYLRQKVRFFHRRGGRVALDDFGTGCSNELVLMSIPFDIVKLDIAFVRNVDKDPQKQLLVRDLTELARSRSLTVLGEGVEDPDDMAFLVSHGVGLLQGFYTGMPGDEPAEAAQEIRERIRSLPREGGTPWTGC